MALYRNIILADNPTAYYRLGEFWSNAGAGPAKTLDESSNWYDGTPTGNVAGTSWKWGQPGALTSAYKSMLFNGTTGYISAATSGLPSGPVHWSIEAWGYTTNAASVSSQTLVAFGTNGASQMAALQFKNTGAGCFAQLNINGTVAAGSVGSIQSYIWYHLVGTYDGTNITLYVNGAQSAQTAASPGIILSFCSIGSINGASDWFIGKVDEAAIYSTPLTLSQISNHYNRGTTTDSIISYPSTVLADTPLTYWRLEETSGTSAKDQGSLGNNGTLHGGVTLAQTGAVANDPNDSFLFDGASGYIALPASWKPAGVTALSVECWVNMTALTAATFPRLVASDLPQTTHNGYDLGVNGTTGAIFWNVGNGTTYATNTNATIAAANAWHHVVGTWDGSNLRVYLDGVVQGAPVALSGTMGTPGFATNIARNPQNSSNFANATIDEVAIYIGTALSATQVANHYNAGIGVTTGPYSVTIGRGAPVTTVSGSLMIDSSIGKRWTASFLVKHANTSTHYKQYQVVSIFDQNGVLQFSGYINTVKEYKPGFQSSLVSQISCIDQQWLADKRIVYNSGTNAALTFSATSIHNIVNSLFNTFLAPENVALGNIDAIANTLNVNFNYPSVSQALDAMVKAANIGGNNWYWYIDQNKLLYFQQYSSAVNNVIIDGSQIDQDRKPPFVQRMNPLYRNIDYVVYGASSASPNSNNYTNAGEVTVQAALDGSSGKVEVATKDTTVGSSDAGTEANALNNRYAVRGIRFDFTSRTCGFSAGQQITVNYSAFGFTNQTFQVENVHIDDLLDGYNLWYTVTAVSGPFDNTWVQFFGGFVVAQQTGSLDVGV